MGESNQEIFRDLALGLTDGLTVPFSVAAGLVSASMGNHVVITGVMAEIIAGSISMGFADYLGIENEQRKDVALNSALRIALSYAVGGLIPLSAYLLIPETQKAFHVSSVLTVLSLAAFGYFRAKFLATDIRSSVMKTVSIGGAAAIATYVVASVLLRR